MHGLMRKCSLMRREKGGAEPGSGLGWALVAALFATAACGVGDEAGFGSSGDFFPPGVGLRISAEDGLERRCRAADAVEAVTVERFEPEAATWTEIARYGDEVCRDGRLPLTGLPDGSHRLRIEAVGRIQGVTDVLFARDVDVDVRLDGSTNPDVVVLAPRVAYFRVSWAPPVEALDQCDDGWSWGFEIEPVLDEANPAPNPSSPIHADYPCEEKTALVHRPLTTGEYEVAVTMYDADGLARFERVDVRVLSPGANEYQALLAPIGGLIAVDWTFEAEGGLTRDCSEFGVEEVSLTLRASDGTTPIYSGFIPCAVPRPTTLSVGASPLRVDADAPLGLEAVAEGRHLFRGAVEFDARPGAQEVLVTLRPLGRGQIAWRVSDDCLRPAPSGYVVTVRRPSEEAAVWSTRTPLAQTSTTTPLLPYGEYVASVRADRATAPCSAADALFIDSPQSRSLELRLGNAP